MAAGTGAMGQTIELTIPDSHPWSPADPFLYGLKVSIGDADREADTVDSYFGLRDVSVGKYAQGRHAHHAQRQFPLSIRAA